MGFVYSDSWSYLDSREPGEARRMRHCRGCIYLGTAGNFANCDYYLRTGQRRGCPAGKGCTRKTVPVGYQYPPGYDEYLAECDRIDEADRIRRQQAEERRRRVIERDKARKKSLDRVDDIDDRDPYCYKQTRGRPLTWDADYAKILFDRREYYYYEIADIVGVDLDTLSDHIRRHKWPSAKTKMNLFRHNIKTEVERYARYRQHVESGKPVTDAFLTELFQSDCATDSAAADSTQKCGCHCAPSPAKKGSAVVG